MDYDLIDTFPEPDDDFEALPACGEWTAGETCGDSLCPAHGAEVQANLRATAELSWVGVIELAREIVRTQDVADRYGRGEIRELPIEPLEPGDLAHALARLWRAERRADDLWPDFAEGLLSGLGYDLGDADGAPIADLDHGGTPEQAAAWRAGRMWAEAWVAAATPLCDWCGALSAYAVSEDPSTDTAWWDRACSECADDPDCALGWHRAAPGGQGYVDFDPRWSPRLDALPWAQPVCRDSAQRCRYQRESSAHYDDALDLSAAASMAQREGARLSELARPWEPAGDVVSDDGRVVRAVDSEDGL